MNQRGFNFNPGPAVLPELAIKAAQNDLWNYQDSGMGVAELSHRGPHFEEIIQDTEKLLRKLLGLSQDFLVLFCTGGATQQFSMIPMNLLKTGKVGSYVVSGVWGDLAAEEARKFGEVQIAASTKEIQYSKLPDRYEVASNAAYLHFTSNNTIVGTQHLEEPDSCGKPLFCDASSDILSRPIPTGKYSLIYAGAQKNIGVAGVTLIILRKSLLEEIPSGLPMLMDYRTYAKSNSLHNTPPTLSIYFMRETLRWLDSLGGLEEVEKRNRAKAELVYQRLDSSEFYQGIVEKSSRSMMNLTFRLKESSLEKVYLQEAEARQLYGLKGHRLLGGFRASLYNALPPEAAQALVDFLNDFEKQHG